MKKTNPIYKSLRYCKYILIRIQTRNQRKKMQEIQLDNDFYSIVEKIITGNRSIVRYGDGELKLLMGINPNDYQEPSTELSNRLKEILQCEDDKILVGINGSLKSNENDDFQQKYFFTLFMYKYFENFYYYFNKKTAYVNASFTRIYMRTNNKKDVPNKFHKMKEIWKNRNVVFVEGEFSKLGVGNDLFDNVKSVKRIICPSKNAYEKYQEIMKECKKQNKDSLFIIALGATATVLAYDLAMEGYQALDLGHIDIEYEWYKMGAKEAVPVKGKYTNESNGEKLVDSIDSNEYEQSVIKRIL